jgi:antitoxin FitA
MPLALWRQWRQNGAMTSIQIKGVPERTHAVLRQRAAAAHQSLQEYLLQHLIEEADRPTLDEVIDAASNRSGGSVSFDEINAIIRPDRDSH